MTRLNAVTAIVLMNMTERAAAAPYVQMSVLQNFAVTYLSIENNTDWNRKSEFRNFNSMVCVSLAEIDTQLLIAARLNYIKPEELSQIQAIQIVLNKITKALMNKLNTTTQKDQEITNIGGE